MVSNPWYPPFLQANGFIIIKFNTSIYTFFFSKIKHSKRQDRYHENLIGGVMAWKIEHAFFRYSPVVPRMTEGG